MAPWQSAQITADKPGEEERSGFPWLLALIAAGGAATWWFLASKKKDKK
jgi:hypothetical protein